MQKLARVLLTLTAAAVLTGTVVSAPAAQATPQVPATALSAVSFPNQADGYGYFLRNSGGRCDGMVGRTADGGAHFTAPVLVKSWSCDSDYPGQLSIASDGSRDVFLYGPAAFVSHDSGHTWSALAGRTGEVVAVSAVGQSVWLLRQSCRAAGRTRLCRVTLLTSSNGGRTWHRPASQPFGTAFPTNLENPSQTWLLRTSRSAGDVILPPPSVTGPLRAPAWHTGNDGATWTAEHIPCPAGASVAVAAVPGRPADLSAVCAGEPGAAHQAKTAADSVNGGRTWTQYRPCPLNLNNGLTCRLDWGYLGQIATPAPGTLFMAGGYLSLEVSTSGGKHWRYVQPPPGGVYSFTIQVQFFSHSEGLLFGLDNNDSIPALWHTGNGGRTWAETIPVIG